MTDFHWKLDLYFSAESRESGRFVTRGPKDPELEKTQYYGRPAYKKTLTADSFEHGSSGTIALYYEDPETGMMRESHSIKDDGLIGVESVRVGEPGGGDDEDEDPDPDGSWEQDAQ